MEEASRSQHCLGTLKLLVGRTSPRLGLDEAVYFVVVALPLLDLRLEVGVDCHPSIVPRTRHDRPRNSPLPVFPPRVCRLCSAHSCGGADTWTTFGRHSSSFS